MAPRAVYAHQLWSLNVGRPVVSNQRIIYNRVGKCGSRSMLLLMKMLAATNNFTFIGSDTNNKLEISEGEQVRNLAGIAGSFLSSSSFKSCMKLLFIFSGDNCMHLLI